MIKFILKDLDTQAVLNSNIYELVIFGCGDMYGPFNTYKEATNFMEEQLSILKEYGE